MTNISVPKLLLHLVILWVATFIGGFIVGLVSAIAGVPLSFSIIGIVNMIVLFLSMVVITRIHRINWQHFVLLFILFTAISLLNVFIAPVTVPQVLVGSVVMTVIGALGKLLGDAISPRETD